MARTLSEALDVLPEILFPLALYRGFIPNDVDLKAAYPFGSQTLERLKKPCANSEPIVEVSEDLLRRQIAIVLKTVSYREREIIKLRYGLGDGYTYTLEELSHIFKVNRERIRQIEAKAVRKLQQPRRSQELVDFLD